MYSTDQIDTCMIVQLVLYVKSSMCGIPGRRYSTSCMMYVHRTVATWYCTRHIRVHVCVPRTCTTSRYTTFLVMVKWTATKKKWKPEWFYFFITLHVVHVECSCQLSTTRQLLFFKKIGYPI